MRKAGPHGLPGLSICILFQMRARSQGAAAEGQSQRSRQAWQRDLPRWSVEPPGLWKEDCPLPGD